ncbi:MAG: LamG domain-containing protein [Deltaproteobacteria bacterium]|nr:LamG domain-containing protein [Deltaproteobacteria bacterium]
MNFFQNCFSNFFRQQKVKHIALITLIVGIASCGGQNAPQNPRYNNLHQLPLKVLKLLPEGEFRGSLQVYDLNDKLIEEVKLEINSSTGEVTSPLFKLPKGETYTFINTFYFGSANVSETAIAAVVKEENVVEDAEEILWTAEEVMTCPGDLPVDLQDNPSLSHLASLDEDNDNFCNFVEIVKGSDPRDANSVPPPPRLEGSIEEIIHEDFIEFKLNARDPMGIAKVRPVQPSEGCGYREFNLSEVVEGDNRDIALQAKFNTHAYSGGSPVELQIEVTDTLGLKEVYSYTAKFIRNNYENPNDPNYVSGPEILVTSPEANSTVSGETNFTAIACDKEGIQDLKFSSIASVDDDEDPARFSSTINTEILSDGPINLAFEALNLNGDTRIISHPIIVDNFAQIQIIEPTGGSTVGDAFTITALLNKTNSDDTILAFRVKEVIDPQGQLTPLLLNNSDANNTDTVFQANVQDTNPNATDREITITFEALLETPSEEVQFQQLERSFTFKINKTPDIRITMKNSQDDSYHDCLKGGYATLNFFVKNLKAQDDGMVEYFTSTDGENYVLKSLLDPQGAESYSFTQEIACSGALSHRIEASRPSSVKENVSYEASKDFDINLVDLSNFSELINSPAETITWDLVNASSDQYWEVTGDINEVPNTFTRSNLEEDKGSSQVVLTDIQPRSLYQVALSLTNSLGEPVSTLENLEFLTLDDNLLLWWPLNSFNTPGYNESIPGFARDLSKNQYSGYLSSTNWNNSPDTRGLQFNGGGMAYTNGEIHGKFENVGLGESENIGYTMETTIYVNENTDKADFIVAKNDELALGIHKAQNQKYYFQVMAGVSSDNCALPGNQAFAEGKGKVIWARGTLNDDANGPPDPEVTLNKWHHLVVTVSTGSNSEDTKYTIKFYINNILKEIRTYDFDNEKWKNTCPFHLTLNGIDYTILQNNIIKHEKLAGNFKGIVGELAIYDRALTAQEIAKNCINFGITECVE